jgi:hypothetical protein
LAAEYQRSSYRDFIAYQFQSKLVLFLDLIDRPTFRAIKLNDKASTVFVLELIDTVFIAVKRGKPESTRIPCSNSASMMVSGCSVWKLKALSFIPSSGKYYE